MLCAPPRAVGPILTEVNWLAHQHNTCAILAAKYRARASAHRVELCHRHDDHSMLSSSSPPLGGAGSGPGPGVSAMSALSSSSALLTPVGAHSHTESKSAEGSLAALVAQKAALVSAVEALKGAAERGNVMFVSA